MRYTLKLKQIASSVALGLLMPPLGAAALEITDLSLSEKESLSLACESREDKEMCHRKQLYALEKIGRNTTYSDLHPIEAEAHQNGCAESFQKGPAVYAYCLKEDFKRWNNSTHVNVSLLDEPTRNTLKSRCREELNSGLPVFSECLVEHLPSVIAESNSDNPAPAESTNLTGQPPSPSLIAITPEELFRKVSPSIVFISTNKSTGSGVVVSPSLILTNHHVVEGASQIEVYLPNQRYQAKVFKSDASKDACVLRVDSSQLRAVKSSRLFEELQIGERVYALGNPKSLTRTFSDGMISGKRLYKGQNIIQITAPIAPGSSGGGLFDGEGRLIGITKGGYGEGNLNFAIPIDAFGDF